MMRHHADILATVDRYKDRHGRECKRSLKVGALMRDPESGRMSLKIDALPVAPSWSGWLKVVRVGVDEDAADELEQD